MKRIFFLLCFLFLVAMGLIAQDKPVKKATNTPVKIAESAARPAAFVPTIAFSSTITQPREILLGTDGNRIRRFDKVEFNHGNAFDPALGRFKAPIDGMYCLLVNVTLQNYGCFTDPISFQLSVMKNNTENQRFYLPVYYGNGFSTQGFTCLISLKAGDVIDLSPLSAACVGGKRPKFDKFVFSGYRVRT